MTRLTAALVGFVALAPLGLLAGCGSDETASRCTDLKSWYAENPGDSNRDIAKDYLGTCGQIPPPVISGELTMSDLR